MKFLFFTKPYDQYVGNFYKNVIVLDEYFAILKFKKVEKNGELAFLVLAFNKNSPSADIEIDTVYLRETEERIERLNNFKFNNTLKKRIINFVFGSWKFR